MNKGYNRTGSQMDHISKLILSKINVLGQIFYGRLKWERVVCGLLLEGWYVFFVL